MTSLVVRSGAFTLYRRVIFYKGLIECFGFPHVFSFTRAIRSMWRSVHIGGRPDVPHERGVIGTRSR